MGSEQVTDKIGNLQLTALLEEYRAVRAQIVSLRGGEPTFGLLSIALISVVFAGIFQFKISVLSFFLPLLILAVATQFLSRQASVHYLDTYASVLERRVNKLVGSQVLTWETFWVESRIPGLFQLTSDTDPSSPLRSGSITFGMSVHFFYPLANLLVYGFSVYLGANIILVSAVFIRPINLVLATLFVSSSALAVFFLVFVWRVIVPRELIKIEKYWLKFFGITVKP